MRLRLLNILTAVKCKLAPRQWLVICLLSSLVSGSAAGTTLCSSVLISSGQIHVKDIDVSHNEKVISQMLERVKVQEVTVYFTKSGLPETTRFPLTDDQIKKAQDLVARSMQRPLGIIYNFKSNENSQEINSHFSPITPNEPIFSENKQLSFEMMRMTSPVRNDFRNKINQIFEVQDQSDVVFININKISNETQALFASDQESLRHLQSFFLTKYVNLVDWIYKKEESHLRNPIDSARMIDDFGSYAKKGFGFKMYLGFQKPIWEKLIQLLQFWHDHPDHKYLNHQRGEFGLYSQDIPLMPFVGLTAAVPFLEHSIQPIELKRYFKNDYDDPFELALHSSKMTTAQRYKLWIHVIESLPAGTKIEIHAPSKVHAIAYRKLGFQITGEYLDPKLNEPQIVLMGERELVLSRIRAIVNNHQSSAAGP